MGYVPPRLISVIPVPKKKAQGVAQTEEEWRALYSWQTGQRVQILESGIGPRKNRGTIEGGARTRRIVRPGKDGKEASEK